MMDNQTIAKNGEVYIELCNSEEISLLNYINAECFEKCNMKWSLGMEPECDCVYARFYYAMAKLAIYEQNIPFKELPKYLKQSKEGLNE